ncbi:hypothetical protein PGT21_025950 [Puccinia graminis f. sp. tritici]|uniref:Uncharacterized protein n=1 Tax=Puccinia graminis f. sp. tritici TaxID=56615 RepID=A0A5B0PYK0_PUCGR|nr:hypothetical protein PGT21_025950 [Puccinia graminis f. sp. tritici]
MDPIPGIGIGSLHPIPVVQYIGIGLGGAIRYQYPVLGPFSIRSGDRICYILANMVAKPKTQTGFLAQLGAASVAHSGVLSTVPLDIWLSGGLILEGSKPVNALEWWLQQKQGGNTYGGLLKMALDQGTA